MLIELKVFFSIFELQTSSGEIFFKHEWLEKLMYFNNAKRFLKIKFGIKTLNNRI